MDVRRAAAKLRRPFLHREAASLCKKLDKKDKVGGRNIKYGTVFI